MLDYSFPLPQALLVHLSCLMQSKEITYPKRGLARNDTQVISLSPWKVLCLIKSILVYLETLDQARYSKLAVTYGEAYISSPSRGAEG